MVIICCDKAVSSVRDRGCYKNPKFVVALIARVPAGDTHVSICYGSFALPNVCLVMNEQVCRSRAHPKDRSVQRHISNPIILI